METVKFRSKSICTHSLQTHFLRGPESSGDSLSLVKSSTQRKTHAQTRICSTQICSDPDPDPDPVKAHLLTADQTKVLTHTLDPNRAKRLTHQQMNGAEVGPLFCLITVQKPSSRCLHGDDHCVGKSPKLSVRSVMKRQ